MTDQQQRTAGADGTWMSGTEVARLRSHNTELRAALTEASAEIERYKESVDHMARDAHRLLIERDEARAEVEQMESAQRGLLSALGETQRELEEARAALGRAKNAVEAARWLDPNIPTGYPQRLARLQDALAAYYDAQQSHPAAQDQSEECEKELRSAVMGVMQEVSDLPPWAYTYAERPDDLLEVRASELQAILEAHLVGYVRRS